MRAIPIEFCPAPAAPPRPQTPLRRNKTTVIYRNFFNQRAKGFSTKGNEDHEEKSRVSDSFFKKMHFHLRYLRFLLFQIPFLIRETLTAVNLRRTWAQPAGQNPGFFKLPELARG
jgi:hypothetical protein